MGELSFFVELSLEAVIQIAMLESKTNWEKVNIPSCLQFVNTYQWFIIILLFY